MKEWNDDKELVSLIKGELYTAVVGDIMDKMGYTHQFLPPHIRPLRDDMFVAGRAMTVLEADVYDNQGTSGTNPVLKRSFGLMLEALDDLKEGEIYICSGSSPSYALCLRILNVLTFFTLSFCFFVIYFFGSYSSDGSVSK